MNGFITTEAAIIPVKAMLSDDLHFSQISSLHICFVKYVGQSQMIVFFNHLCVCKPYRKLPNQINKVFDFTLGCASVSGMSTW